MSLKTYLFTICLALSIISLSAEAATFTSIAYQQKANAPAGNYIADNLNAAQELNIIEFSGAAPEKILLNTEYQGGGGNQSSAALEAAIIDEFDLASLDFVRQGGGSNKLSKPGDVFNFLAVHIGKNEFIFHFLTAIDSFNLTAPEKGNGIGDWRAYNGVYAPSQVPVPAAVWLFGSAFAGMFGFKRKASK